MNKSEERTYVKRITVEQNNTEEEISILNEEQKN